ncbi:MAG: prepilin-type N-terminal cleavage/methylation domain-containing protein [Desulfobacterales bacterium]|jgi:type IV pilus modification protein PilV|nr:prepilin-type N-terminal cleavage/methylation domain-containing protein [Desulfobacterales bacterium]
MDTGRFFDRLRNDSARGFSLIEVMVALVVLSVGLLGIFKLQATATDANSRSRAITEGAIMAGAVAERLLALPYDHPDLSAGEHTQGAATDGLDNNMNGGIDENGEKGYIAVRWDITEGCLGPNVAAHKCVRLRVNCNVNNRREIPTVFDFVKTGS